MSWLGLRYKRVEPLYIDEWNKVVDGLDILFSYVQKGITSEQLKNLQSDVIPAQDGKYDLGTVNKRWDEVYAYYGNFATNVYVQGKRVLKDGDPISIYDIQDLAKLKISEAIDDTFLYKEVSDIDSKLDTLTLQDISEVTKEKISQAIDNSLLYKEINDIYLQLLLLNERKKIKLLASVLRYYVLSDTDVFDNDITVDRNGRVRFKLLLEQGGFVKVKWTPSGATSSVIGYLNSANEIPANSWYEFDFTVMENDKVNVRVIPAQNVTIFIYGLGET